MAGNRKWMTELIIIVSIAIAPALSCAMVRANFNPADPGYDLHSIIVKFKPHTISLPFGGQEIHPSEAAITASSINDLNVKYKVTKLKKVFKYAQEGITSARDKRGRLVKIKDLSGYYTIYFPGDVDVKEALKTYKNDPNVENVTLNYKVYMKEVPSDADFPLQWGLITIEAPAAWDTEKGSSEVIIAVVDSGVQTNHPDLLGKLTAGYNFIEENDDPNPIPVPGANNEGCLHGTHVAGIAAAVTGNHIADSTGGSVAGVAWNCLIMPVKVLDNTGSSSTLTPLVNGIDFAANNGADVISMSLGTQPGGYSEGALQDAIDNAYSLGCVIVAAAGNDGINITSDSNKESPVCNDGADNEVVGVAATTNKDTKAYYSNYSSTFVDVSAPGGDFSSAPQSEIYSTVYHNTNHNYYWWHDSSPGVHYYFDDWYTYLAGTSMATPFVSGLAALIKSQHPELSPAGIIDILQGSTDYIGFHSTPGDLGAGRIDAKNAVRFSNFSAIIQPRQASVVLGYVTITGTATWEGSGFYKLSVGAGSSPSTFEEIASSETPVVRGTLGHWDTTGLGGTYTIKLAVNDLETLESSVSVQVGDIHSKIIGKSISGPNPFNPRVNPEYVFNYKLSANADTTISIYDLQGTLLWKKRFPAGGEGGRQGDNKPKWNGRSDFGGGYLANGVYLYQIVSRNTIIGNGKILMFK